MKQDELLRHLVVYFLTKPDGTFQKRRWEAEIAAGQALAVIEGLKHWIWERSHEFLPPKIEIRTKKWWEFWKTND